MYQSRFTGASLLFTIWCIFTNWNVCLGMCNRATGPSGSVDCFLGAPYYSKYQWGTCLTDSYIKQKSGGKHKCRDPTATYCYYQCMLEVHGVDHGPVYSDCLCSGGSSSSPTYTTPTGTPLTTLPPWCSSPDGSDCSWYRQCLEKKYPCEDSQYGYAISYAEKFCNLYTKSSTRFSSIGQKWINAARKCLQVSLVPLLRPWESPSCRDIKVRAFASHTNCYLHPYVNAPSICDLPVGDWWKVFWTIKSAYVEATLPTLKGTLETAIGCGNQYMDEAYEFIRIIRLQVTNVINRFKRSADENPLDALAGDVADSIAEQLGWKSSGVGWFAYAENDTLEPTEKQSIVNISIIIADQSQLDVNVNSSTILNLNETVDALADAVQSGSLKIKIKGKSDEVSIKTMMTCVDVACNNTYMMVFGAATSSGSSTATYLPTSTFTYLPTSGLTVKTSPASTASTRSMVKLSPNLGISAIVVGVVSVHVLHAISS